MQLIRLVPIFLFLSMPSPAVTEVLQCSFTEVCTADGGCELLDEPNKVAIAFKPKSVFAEVKTISGNTKKSVVRPILNFEGVQGRTFFEPNSSGSARTITVATDGKAIHNLTFFLQASPISIVGTHQRGQCDLR